MKVLVIYNVDPDWDEVEIFDSRKSAEVLYRSLLDEGIDTVIEEITDPFLDKVLKKYDPERTIIFNICETLPGSADSETKVLEIIKEMGFNFTGNDTHVLELSYHKQKVKKMMARNGITVPEGLVLSSLDFQSWNRFPAIVKPSYEHCSLTLTEKSVVFDNEALREQILLVEKELQQPALVEEFIDGREFHVSVLNNDPPEMLPPAEMDFSAFPSLNQRLCTYDSKFIPGSEHYEKIKTVISPYLDTVQLESLKKIVFTAWEVSGCRDYARFDLRLYNGRFYLLDINPNNDISYDTSFALAGETAGYTYGQLVKKIVQMALKRHATITNKTTHMQKLLKIPA